MIEQKYLKNVKVCPWCGLNEKQTFYTNKDNIDIQECTNCGLIYSSKILNSRGRKVYWNNYLSQVHNIDNSLVKKRAKMYKIEFDFINQFIVIKNKDVLDIGCGNGDFLNFFNKAEANCYGIEYGVEAAKMASRNYFIWFGEFPQICIEKKFDLIIFRGSLQYCVNPKQYLKKAMNLLKKNGILYITSTPNAQSLCFQLFKGNFTLPVDVTDYYGFTELIITNYIHKLGGKLLCQQYFYKETPYANVENDILTVAKAIIYQQQNKTINFKSPAFYDNMLTLIYQKIDL